MSTRRPLLSGALSLALVVLAGAACATARSNGPDGPDRAAADPCDPSVCAASSVCVDGRCETPCTLPTVYFDFDEFSVRPDARALLDEAATCIVRLGRAVEIGGHTDERGSDEFLLAISVGRANAVMRYLVKRGVPRELLTAVGWGEERPVCREHSEDCWWRNRRAELTFR